MNAIVYKKQQQSEPVKMREKQMKAMAKINLGLDVLGRRADGYHELRMVMQSVRLYDRLTLRESAKPGIRLSTNLRFLPTGPENLVCRAAQLMTDEFGIREGLDISLYKFIPVSAGLGGGSSDAAAVLVGMNQMYHLGLSTGELMERGLKLGADVPFCVLRRTALAEGVGEKLTPLENAPRACVLLAKPPVHVSTRSVYEELDRSAHEAPHPDIDGQLQAIRDQDLKKMASLMGNVLESVTIPAFPEIRQIKEQMIELGAAGAMMSGSGPTVFGLFEDRAAAENACAVLRAGSLARNVFLTEFL